MRKKIVLCAILLNYTFSFCQGQNWQWGKQGNTMGSGWGEGCDINADANGNAYLSGFFPYSIKFGSFNLISHYYDVYLAKYDNVGNVLWAKQSKCISSNTYTRTMNALDGSGNIYLSGTFYDTVYFGANKLYSYQNSFFLVKYDSNGNVLWAQQAKAGLGNVIGYDVTTDVFGNVFVSGHFQNGFSIGTYTLTSANINNYNSFLLKFDSNGNILWARQSITPNSNSLGWGLAVSTDKNGNAYLSGCFSDTVTFGSYHLHSIPINGSNVYIIKYDSAGNVLWAKQSTNNSAGSSIAYSIITDASCNEYVTGYYTDSISFGPYKLSGYGAYNIFLAKYNSIGNVVWAKKTINLDNNYWIGWSLQSDKFNNIYLSGGIYAKYYPNEKILFDKDTFSVNNAFDPSIYLKLDSNGNLLCGTLLPSGADDWNVLASNQQGTYVYAGGDMYGINCIFGNDTLIADNKNDEYPFIAQWSSCNNINDNEKEIEPQTPTVKICPIPNNGFFKIVNSKSNQTVNIYNMLGEMVFKSNLIGDKTQINIKNPVSGIYLYRIVDEKGVLVFCGKFIIEI